MSYDRKKVCVQIEYLSRGFTQAHEGLKWISKTMRMHVIIISRKEGVKRRYQTNRLMDLSELRAIYSLHIEGTNTLVMGGLS